MIIISNPRVIREKTKLIEILGWYRNSKLRRTLSQNLFRPLSCAWWCLAQTGQNPHATSTLDISWAILMTISSFQWICTSPLTYWSMWGLAKISTWTRTRSVFRVISQLSWPCQSQSQHIIGLSLRFSGTIRHSKMLTSAKTVLKLWSLAQVMLPRVR
jgi:hypothetical protein